MPNILREWHSGRVSLKPKHDRSDKNTRSPAAAGRATGSGHPGPFVSPCISPDFFETDCTADTLNGVVFAASQYPRRPTNRLDFHSLPNDLASAARALALVQAGTPIGAVQAAPTLRCSMPRTRRCGPENGIDAVHRRAPIRTGLRPA